MSGSMATRHAEVCSLLSSASGLPRGATGCSRETVRLTIKEYAEFSKSK